MHLFRIILAIAVLCIGSVGQVSPPISTSTKTFINLVHPKVPYPTTMTPLASVKLPAGVLNRVGQSFEVWAEIAQTWGYGGNGYIKISLCDLADCSGSIIADLSDFRSSWLQLPNFACFADDWFACSGGQGGFNPTIDIRGTYVVTAPNTLLGSGNGQSNNNNSNNHGVFSGLAMTTANLAKGLYVVVSMQVYSAQLSPVYRTQVMRVTLAP